MKLIKLKLALVVALLSFAFVSASASDYDFEVDGLGYKIISLEDLSCSVADEVEHHTELEIPSIVTYKGRSLSVIKIENHAFKLSLASNVVIPNSILTIGEGAFEECYSLKNVTIGNSVDTIGARAFYRCMRLESLTIPNSVKVICGGVFYGCDRLKTLKIADGESTLHLEGYLEAPIETLYLGRSYSRGYNYHINSNNEFSDAITTVEIGSSVTQLPECFLQKCTNLSKITIPRSITEIGIWAFGGCSNLGTVVLEDGDSTLNIGYGCFSGCPIGELHVGRNLSGANVFANRSDLWNVSFGNNVTTIPNGAFAGSATGAPEGEGYLAPYLPSSLITIGESAFENSGWTFGDLVIPNSVVTIGDRAFSGVVLDKVDLGFSVTSIGESAFAGSRSVTSFTSRNLTPPVLGDNNFTNSQYINMSIYVPAEAISAYQAADNWKNFWEINEFNLDGTEFGTNGINYRITSFEKRSCEVIKSGYLYGYETDKYAGDVVIPSTITFGSLTFSVDSIADKAFYECTDLTSVTIPSTVTKIGEYAFSGCSGLKHVTIPSSITKIDYAAFRECSSLENIIVDKGNEIYDSRENCNAIILTATNSLIYGCSSTVIPNSVTSIETYAFFGCSSLENIVIPNSVTSIGYYAFTGCSSLTSIIVDKGNEMYDSRENCNAIILTATNSLIYGCSSTVIPNSVTSIETYAFFGCSSLENIVIPNSVTSIGFGAFLGCSSLKNIVIPNSVTLIGDYAFDDCSSLTSIVIPNSVTLIGSRAFMDCSSLTNIAIPNSVTSIEYATFWYCSSLENIVIPNSVTSIGSGAFFGCSSLPSIVIPNSITSIGSGAFGDLTKLSSITSLNITPPTIIGGNSCFDYTHYKQATLYVPQEAIEAYRTAHEWKDFKNIQAVETSGINSVECDRESLSDIIYDLNGRRLSKPQNGINIINGKKVLMK